MKRVALINDLSGLGRCSLTAALPVLSVMGVQPCAMPTAVLTNQTGYPSFTIQNYTPCVADYVADWKKAGMTFDAISTGFLTSEQQVEDIHCFLKAFRRPESFLLVDPIMGDDGDRYPSYSEALCARITELAMQADVVTPNLTEACLLTGANYREVIQAPSLLQRAAELGQDLRQKGIGTVVITGIKQNDHLTNLVIDATGVHEISSPCVGGSYSGTGDLLASVLCGGLLTGATATEAVELATRFIVAALNDTVAAGSDRNDGVLFEQHLSLLTRLTHKSKD
ncbi:MAG: pyridoxamine kinase [Clostridia bacterium]|nr:pyridoxamine kinase [Clostridia bacterium]